MSGYVTWPNHNHMPAIKIDSVGHQWEFEHVTGIQTQISKLLFTNSDTNISKMARIASNSKHISSKKSLL